MKRLPAERGLEELQRHQGQLGDDGQPRGGT